MSKIVFAAVAAASLAAIFTTASCSHGITAQAAVKDDKDRKAAPQFSLTDSNGHTVHLADYKGKVVLLDFWATWCSPCKVEIPWFMEFEQQYRDRGFAVLGVSMDDDGWSAVKPYIAQMKINYRIALGNDQVGNLYGGVDALPSTFLIDRQGKIASAYQGLERGKEAFRNDILRLLDAPRAGVSPSGSALLASAR